MEEEQSADCDATDEFILKMAHSNNNLFSGNSFDLNSATLSDDSGFVPHTNSSISSGSSRGVGLCRFEFELAESDAEVSQFDSLDNFSDGGMSAENFNTLKKGPFLEPPPEFQDSPQTTLLRSPYLQNYSFRLTKAIITNAISDYSAQVRSSSVTYFDTSSSSGQTTIAKKPPIVPPPPCLLHSKQLYGGSDSFLSHYDSSNIYDEPNSEFYDNHLLYVNKAVHQHHTMQDQVYDYDLYYFKRRNLTPVDSYKRRRTPTSSLLYSPLHHHHHHYHYYHTGSSSGNRPNSRNSLNSRLSSSHNSLSVPTANKADDSIFITQAMSHDALVGREISDMYNVPIDSDIYALPVDSVKVKGGKKSAEKPRKSRFTRNNKRRRRHLHTSRSNATNLTANSNATLVDKRHSVPENRIEPLHMTLDEVKRYYHNLYSSSSESSEVLTKKDKNTTRAKDSRSAKVTSKVKKPKERPTIETNNNKPPPPPVVLSPPTPVTPTAPTVTTKKSQFSITFNLRQKFCNIFRFRHKNREDGDDGTIYNNHCSNNNNNNNNNHIKVAAANSDKKQCNEDKRIQLLSSRALPPLPQTAAAAGNSTNNESAVTTTSLAAAVTSTSDTTTTTATTAAMEMESVGEMAGDSAEMKETRAMDFAANIEKVKECGWYWGPISSETAEKILSNEPDGSFIVRDSSDDHYIFSLTFKIAGCVRHVRIEQDQGTFSFGSCAKFKSRTIVEFIENAVENSRSGRYLFFLNRRPEHGPMRIQLLEPVSRFKRIQSLQHMCRFVIRKTVVRKDLIQTLPLPRRILDYLSYKNCFSEQIESDSSSQSQIYGKNNDDQDSSLNHGEN